MNNTITTICVLAHPHSEVTPPATVGSICKGCASSIRWALGQAAAIAEHVAGQVNPGIRAVDTEGASQSGKTASGASKLPLDASALDHADEIYGTLCNAVILFGKVYKETALPLPAPRSPRGYRNTVRALPAGLTPTHVHTVVRAQASFLLARFDRIAAAGTTTEVELLEDVARAARCIGQASKRYPREAAASYSELPHPGCGGRVAVYSPLNAHEARAVQCERCNEVIPHETVWERELVLAGATATTTTGKQAAGILRHMQGKIASAKLAAELASTG